MSEGDACNGMFCDFFLPGTGFVVSHNHRKFIYLMEPKEIQSNYTRAVRFALHDRVKDAFTLTGRLIREADSSIFSEEHQQLEENYRWLTYYAFQGTNDPERQKVLNNLMRRLLELNDKVYYHLRKPYFENVMRNYKDAAKTVAIGSEADADKLLEEISFSREVTDVLQGAAYGEQSETTVEGLFYYFLFQGKMTAPEGVFIEKLASSETFAWNEKSLMVSAITLSLVNCFDEKKFQALFTLYQGGEDKVWQRALVGLVLGFYLYDSRIHLYPSVKGLRFQLGENSGSDKDIEAVIIQFIRSKDTEQVTKKMQEEIIPEMIKLKPKIEDKLSLEELLQDDMSDDKNPKWETFFKDTPGLADKMEEFSKMQMEGADVFMSAFSMLKQFDFFKELVNWFRPFYAENEQVRQVMKNEEAPVDGEKFLKGIEGSSFICNSDKYSFLLNLRQMPSAQKQTMFSMMQAELEQMNEMARQDEMIDDTTKNKTVFVQYIQDMYRFFKLSRLKDEFGDIFSYKLDVHNTDSFGQIVSDNKVVRNIAEFYFESEHYQDAVSIYDQLLQKGVNEPEVYEKLGYAYQKMEQYDDALTNHKKAELFDSNRVWNLKQIGYCLRKLGRSSEAITYYRDAERLASDDMRLKAAIAYTYLQQKHYEEAMEYYQQLDQGADSKATKRPVAWCAFLLGKTDMAQHYYSTLIEEGPNHYDLMNMGHVQWVLGNTDAAVDYYIRSIRSESNSLKKFLIGFEDDKNHLIAQGIDAETIPLVIDYMRYQLSRR